MPHKVLSAEIVQDSSSEANSSSDDSSSESSSDSEPEQNGQAGASNTSPQKRKLSSPQNEDAKRLKTSAATQGNVANNVNSRDKPKSDASKSSDTESSSGAAESGSDDESDSNSDSDSSESSKDSKSNNTPQQQPPKVNGHSQPNTPSKDTAADTTSAPTRAPPTWHPPSGFAPLSKVRNAHSDLSQLFSKENLAAKQIWHITAPASVPLASITSLQSDQLTKGQVCISHEGNDYAFRTDKAGAGGHKAVPMVPGKTDGFFRTAAKGGFSQVLHLHQVLPSMAERLDGVAADEDGVGGDGGRKKPREQPKGLRTRWWPAGFEDSGGEEEAVASGPADAESKAKEKVAEEESSSSSSDGSEEDDSDSDSSSGNDSDSYASASESGPSAKPAAANTKPSAKESGSSTAVSTTSGAASDDDSDDSSDSSSSGSDSDDSSDDD